MKFLYPNSFIMGLMLVMLMSFIFMCSCSGSSVFLFWPISINSMAQLELITLIDLTSTIFMFTVSLISVAVFMFSVSYMSPDKFFLRFKMLLLSFVISMGALILCPNLISMLLGWDGLGVTSYLLVIYYSSPKSYNAGMVTAMTNRLGDILIIMSAAIMLSMGTWVTKVNSFEFDRNLFLQAMMSVGCFTKSAQIPFSAWLPAAMAAPTPVSSLVHSSTLVTAGVYVLIRHIENLYIFMSQDLIVISGMMTMIMASVSALGETDMKKMVALSTLSQLGIMVGSIGMGWMLMAFMHLIIHAYFKAMMFISTGNSIHLSNSYQACSKTGFLSLSSPVNTSSLVVGGFSLIGAPFAAAFFSKEPILEGLLHMDSINTYLAMLMGVSLTMLYSFRFMYAVLSAVSKMESSMILSEDDYYSSGSVLVLFIPSFSSGVAMSNCYLNLASSKVLFPEGWKASVFVALALGVALGLLYLSKTLMGFAQHDLTYMWSLPNFSSSLMNLMMFISGKFMLVSGFSWNVAVMHSTSLRSREGYLVFMSENSFIYRMVLFIPMSVLFLLVLLSF